MIDKRLWASLLGFTAVAGGLFAYDLAADRTPVLGLDLKGGLSAIFTTAEPATPDELVVVRDLMRDQLESFGVAEPDVRVEGPNIVVDLPNVSDQATAFEALKVSGIVELRPALACQINPEAIAAANSLPPGSTSPSTGSTVPATVDAGSATAAGVGSSTRLPRLLRATPTSTTAPSTTSPSTAPPSDSAPPDSEPSAGDPSTSETPASSVPAVVPSTVPIPAGPPAPTTTLPDVDLGIDTLTTIDGFQTCRLGPAGATGEVFERGSAGVGINQAGQWAVNVSLRGDGQAAWDAIAQQCFNRLPTCPSPDGTSPGQLAIVLDDVIQSAPSVNTLDFGSGVEISGSFEESEARSLARVLNRGAFPVEVVQQRIETVSPTAGQESLNAAVIAGLIGIAVMLLFMALYYRKLAIVIVFGLIVWAMAVYALASFVSNTWNYALTLAGATGIIVAVGVTVDTYVVFFERIRDEMRHGRSLVNAAPRSFAATWRTIVAADLVSLLASVILFWLSVGSVKGFALYLGLTTVCDLLVCYFVTRPATYLLARSAWFGRQGRASATAGGAA